MLALTGGYGGSIYELVAIYFAISVAACIAYALTQRFGLAVILGTIFIYAAVAVLSVFDQFFSSLWRDIIFLYPRFTWNWELFLLLWLIPLTLASASVIVIRQ